MPNRRLNMRKIRDVLRLNAAGMGTRQVASCLGISRDSAKDYLARASAAKLNWPLPDDMDDKALEDKLFPKIPNVGAGRMRKPEPDYNYIHEQLKRKDATLEALHQEFLQNHLDGISYPLMCARYRDYKKSLRRYLRKTYKGGEIVFVDYSGRTVPIYDPKSKEFRKAQIFVGVLAASNYTFAEATWSQQIPDWIESHNNMFTFFGGVPSQVTPDNLKSAVTRPSRGEAQIQETYQDMARHYGTVIIPARVKKPKDKAKAEFGVLLVQRWILFRLRNQKFTSLGELNKSIKTLLVDLNNRPFQKLPGSRRSAFETIDRPALKPLPFNRYDYVKFFKVRAGADYHVLIEGHSYSVPHKYAHKVLDVRVTARAVEVIHNGARIASHPVSQETGGKTTLDDHMPPNHRGYARWDAERDLRTAETIGPNMTKFIAEVFEGCPQNDGKYRQSNAFKALRQEFEPNLIEEAAKKAVDNNYNKIISTLRSLIKNGHCGKYQTEDVAEADFDHKFVRGSDYYH